MLSITILLTLTITIFSQNQSEPQSASSCSKLWIHLRLSHPRWNASVSVHLRVSMGKTSTGTWVWAELRWGWLPGNTSFMIPSITMFMRWDRLKKILKSRQENLGQYWRHRKKLAQNTPFPLLLNNIQISPSPPPTWSPQFSSLQLCSRWYPHAQKCPYGLHHVFHMFLKVFVQKEQQKPQRKQQQQKPKISNNLRKNLRVVLCPNK